MIKPKKFIVLTISHQTFVSGSSFFVCSIPLFFFFFLLFFHRYLLLCFFISFPYCMISFFYFVLYFFFCFLSSILLMNLCNNRCNYASCFIICLNYWDFQFYVKSFLISVYVAFISAFLIYVLSSFYFCAACFILYTIIYLNRFAASTICHIRFLMIWYK